MSSLAFRNIFRHFPSALTGRANLLTLLFSLMFSLGAFSPHAWAADAEVIGPELKFQDGQIHVAASLSLQEKSLQELRNGVTKELRFHIDLFKVWKMWPDEYVGGRFFIRTLKSDPVTLEYKATSNDGNTIVQKKFKSFESMLQWALSVGDVKLANMRDLEPGTYFVRVTVQSKIRKLPPVIGYFMVFLPENEFEIRKDSASFSVGTQK
jgi:hypothetical protein